MKQIRASQASGNSQSYLLPPKPLDEEKERATIKELPIPQEISNELQQTPTSVEDDNGNDTDDSSLLFNLNDILPSV